MEHRTILFARHGETEWSRTERVQGWAPVALTEKGHDQAADLAEHLTREYDLNGLISSDLRRTRETAEHISEVSELAVETDRQWRERNFGIYQGLSDEVFFGEYPEFNYSNVGERAFRETPEEGESWYDVQDRVSDAWDTLLDETTGTVVVTTHTGVLACVVSLITDRDLAESFEPGFDYCGVTTVDLTEDGTGAEIRSIDDSSFLESDSDR